VRVWVCIQGTIAEITAMNDEAAALRVSQNEVNIVNHAVVVSGDRRSRLVVTPQSVVRCSIRDGW